MLLNCILFYKRQLYGGNSTASVSGSEKYVRLHHFHFFKMENEMDSPTGMVYDCI